MKTTAEIKKGLEYLSTRDPAEKIRLWQEGIAYAWQEDAAADAIALIQQLQAENTEKDERIQQLEAERDAAVSDLEHVKDCDSCKYDNACFTGKKDCFGCHEKRCPCLTCQYEWRGVQKEEVNHA